MKEEKKIAVIIMVGALVILGWFLAKWLINKSKTTTTDTTTDGSSEAAATFPLRKGSGITLPGSEEVTHLQKWLNATAVPGMSAASEILPHSQVAVDGKFGSETENSLYTATSMKQVTQAYYLSKGMQNY